jgi:hypothetical protein
MGGAFIGDHWSSSLTPGAITFDPMNALFKDDWLIHNDVPEDLIEQVTVGVDPSGGGDEVGIVAPNACTSVANASQT